MNKIKMVKIFTAFTLLLFLASAASATSVEVTGDKEVVWIGQTIHINLTLQSEKKITGELTLVNLDEKKQEKILFQSVMPSCTCKTDTRVIGEITDTSSFTPQKLGNYQAIAYFDGVKKTYNFTVKSRLVQDTTTTMQPTTTTSSTTTTTSTTSSTSTLKPETTTTLTSQPTTTVPQESKLTLPSFFDGCPCDWAPVIIFLILVFLALVDAGFKHLGRNKKSIRGKT